MPKNAQHIKEDSEDKVRSSTASSPRLQAGHFITIIIVVIVLIVLIVFAVASLGSTQNEYEATANNGDNISNDLGENPIENDRSDTDDENSFYALTSRNLSTITDTTTPRIVSFINNNGFSGKTMSEDNMRAITEALLPYVTENIPIGFLMLNLNSGYGISYNIDTEIYGASTFKAAFVLYICQNLLETGLCTLDDSITYYLQDENDQSYYAYGTNTLHDTIYECIVESDNDAYISLREAFDEQDFDTWLASFNCVVNSAESPLFPTYNVRNAAKIWLEIYNYLNTDTEFSNYLKNLLTQTQTSFLREALKDYGGVVVADKAGWYDEGPSETSIYDCVNDSGIINYEGTDYIFCVMTGVADNDTTENNFKTLVNAIFSARDQLTEESD